MVKNLLKKNYKKYKYYLKLDIHKFYPSVDSSRLFEFVKTKVKDKRFLILCKTIILSEPNLPIGSYYSQWFANWYLQDIDYFIKQDMATKCYVRYVDDMVLFGNNKRKLYNTMYNLQRKLKEKGLHLKRYEQVHMIDERPLDFLGFKFCKNKICLRTRNFKQLNKRLKRVRKTKHVCVSQARSLLSYTGWLKQTKLGYLYYKNHIKPIVKHGTLREIVSKYDKKLYAV